MIINISHAIALIYLTTVVACHTVIGEIFGFLPGGGASLSPETQFLMVVLHVIVFFLAAVRLVSWIAFTKLGAFGRWFGKKTILAILWLRGTKSHKLFRDAIVRMVYEDITGKRVSSIKTIQKRCRGETPARKPRTPKKAAPDGNVVYPDQWKEAA